MKRVVSVFCVLVALGSARPSAAAELYVSGEQAYRICLESEEWCVGFVTGALDGWAALEAYFPGDRFCTPESLTTGEITAMFKEDLENRPDRTATPGAYVLFELLIANYPCA